MAFLAYQQARGMSHPCSSSVTPAEGVSDAQPRALARERELTALSSLTTPQHQQTLQAKGTSKKHLPLVTKIQF